MRLIIAIIFYSISGGTQAVEDIPGFEFDLLRRGCTASDIAASAVASWTVQSQLVLCLSRCAATADLTASSSYTACSAAVYRDSDGRCSLLSSIQLAALLANKSASIESTNGCPGRQIWLVKVQEPTTTAVTTTTELTTTDLPGATYIGCYIDKTSKRDLSKDKITSSSMTRLMCLNHCSSRKRNYFGLQFSKECFCDNSYGNYGSSSESDCNMPCRGNPDEMCGGSSRNSVYRIH